MKGRQLADSETRQNDREVVGGALKAKPHRSATQSLPGWVPVKPMPPLGHSLAGSVDKILEMGVSYYLGYYIRVLY